jgi:uncharacterized membrane protein
MLELAHVWWLAALVPGTAAYFDLRARRWGNALFWAIIAATFAGGDAMLAANKAGNRLPVQIVGAAVVALALLASTGLMRRAAVTTADPSASQASRLGHRLFVPALLIPAVTALVYVVAKYVPYGGRLFEQSQASLVALAVGCTVGLVAAVRVTGSTTAQAFRESSRLLDALSWAVILPMLLAALGGVFAQTGVGNAVASIVSQVIATDSRVACLLAYALGMMMFTVVMGNAFAAFPVIAGGIGLPLLVHQHGADPAVIGSLGMLTGYCGTLLTPMAANFNIVPAVLLELKNPYGVIREQWPTAAALAAVNIVLMYFLAFR